MSGTLDRSNDGGEGRGRPATAVARKQLAASSAVAASLVCGLLIWAKLRLVTDIPRTAYANPERSVEGAEPGRGADATPEETEIRSAGADANGE